MDIQEFIAIGVVGGLLSLVIEFVAQKVSNPTVSKLITLAFSIVVAGAYVWVRSTPYFETVLLVLGSASIVYGFFLNKKN